jgi:hypothetical protein
MGDRRDIPTKAKDDTGIGQCDQFVERCPWCCRLECTCEDNGDEEDRGDGVADNGP